MIISRQKEFEKILKALEHRDIFIVGCGKCAAKQHLGGEPEVLEMKRNLGRSGKNVVGWTILGSACNIASWDDVLSQNPDIGKAESLLVMSCGAGVSVISSVANRAVYPALDTESLGGVCSGAVMTGQCGMCGDCDIRLFGGICPSSQCPKGMRNGPCGGAVDGKCELDERKCIWDDILKRLDPGMLEVLKDIRVPKDHSKRRRG